MFNTLSYAKKLEEVGIPREQAEAHIQIMAEIIEVDVATKADLVETKNELRAEMNSLRIDLINRMETLEYRLTIKLGAFMTIGFATMTALLKIFLIP